MDPKKYCLKHGLTGTDLALLVGLDKSTISRLLSGKGVSFKNAIKIEEKTGGEITREDIRPDIFGPPKRRRRKPFPMAPTAVAETATPGQDYPQDGE